MTCSGPAERVSQINGEVKFTLRGRKYTFEGDEYTIKLLDDGRIVDEVSGVFLEPKRTKSTKVGVGISIGTGLGCGCCFGALGAVIGAVAALVFVYRWFVMAVLSRW